MDKIFLLIAGACFGLVSPFASADPIDQFGALFRQAESDCAAKQFQRAAELSNQALTLPEYVIVGSGERARKLASLAECYRDMNQLTLAEDAYKRALEVLQSPSAQDTSMLKFFLVSLADIYVLELQPARAEPLALRAVAIAEKSDDSTLIGPLGTLGSVYLSQGRLAAAKSTLERALAIADKYEPKDGTYFRNLYKQAAKLYRMTGDESAALDFENRSSKVVTTISVVTNVRPLAPATPARLVANSCQFKYPDEALLYELAGSASVKFSVDVMGKPQYLAIVTSSGWQLLDRATLEGVSHCRYSPATRDGKPVQVGMSIGYEWRLDSDTPNVPPKLITDSCPPSDRLSVAPENTKQSTIRVRFLLDPEGKPYRSLVEGAQYGKNIDSMAIQFVEGCRYQPTIFDGKPVPTSANIRLFLK